jgi:hypothetical protein
MFFSEDTPLDRLEVKIATPKSPTRPDYSKVGKSAQAKKRKRGPADSTQLVRSEAEVDNEIGDEDEWRWRDGMMAKWVSEEAVDHRAA